MCVRVRVRVCSAQSHTKAKTVVCPPLRPLSSLTLSHLLTLNNSQRVASAHICVFVYLPVFTSQQLDMVYTLKAGPWDTVNTDTYTQTNVYTEG